MKIYEVGGAVRDELMGLPIKDMDYAVVVDSFDEMRTALFDMGFYFYNIKPEYFTIRALAPKGSKLGVKSPVADFVMCRKDGPYSDGRRPDYVEPGTIFDDLSRRDFTINAIARDVDTGELIDPFNGQKDIEAKRLIFVGEPEQRIREDGLRVLRALRFAVTKGFELVHGTYEALTSPTAVEMVHKVAIERIREELERMFQYDTLVSLDFLTRWVTKDLREAIFRSGLRLQPTLKS